MNKRYTAIGLMSGTSLDGIDCALIHTDGFDYIEPIDFLYMPYNRDLKERLRDCFGQLSCSIDIVHDITMAHASLVSDMLSRTDKTVDVIGFHGQTIYHAPHDGVTVQIGDGALLARETGIPVVSNMRSNDVAHGGQGAPLAPLYHAAMAMSVKMDMPVVLVNVGGVSNVTYIDKNTVIALDTGPGNALMDDFMLKTYDQPFDENGDIASSGTTDTALLKQWMKSDFFEKPAPKSLDRDAWNHVQKPDDMRDVDYMATLLNFSVEGVLHAIRYFPQSPACWVLSGGGRYNSAFVKAFEARVKSVRLIDDFDWNGDAVEAECFAYLAVRSILKQPLSLPTTTGVSKAVSGGVYSEL